MSKLLTLTLESGEKVKVPFNETSTFKVTTRTFPDPASGPVDVEKAYSGVVGVAVSELRGEDPLPQAPGKNGFESAENAVEYAAALPTGEGAAHIEQALVKWPRNSDLKAELERYDAAIRATPNDAPVETPPAEKEEEAA